MPITLERTPHQKQVFVKALLQSGVPVSKATKLAHLSHGVVEEIRRRNTYDLQSISDIQKRLPAKAYITADWAFDNVTPEKLEACSAPQLMMVAGIAIDKARDMEGLNRPVFNIVDLSVRLDKAMAESRARLSAIDAALSSESAK